MGGKRRLGPNKAILGMAFVVFLSTKASEARYNGGTGEPDAPYRIATAEDLNDIGNHVEDYNKYFVCVNDINLADYSGTQFNIIGSESNPFTGVFDGNDKIIWNFTWSCANRDFVGLFGCLDGGGQIKDLRMENVDVNALNGKGIGSLVGGSSDSSITNCYSEGRVGVMANGVGGLVGFNSYYSMIIDCYWTGSVDGNDYVGALVGSNRGTITNCRSAGSVSGREEIGGLVGNNTDGTITGSHSAVLVAGERFVGGLAGGSHGMITKCCSTGSVSGTEYVGGLVGYSGFHTATDCYSTCTVDGNDYVGGLVGCNNSYRTMTNCYSRGSVDANNYVGGLVGYHKSWSGLYASCFWDSEVNPDVNGIGNADDPNVTGRKTSEMQTGSTFTDAGWDFVEVWGIGENQTYPFLLKHVTGDLNHSGLVDWRDFAILGGHWLEGAE
ncbi:MAG: GLUG motif-containing protein [Planctomycetota bacterium]